MTIIIFYEHLSREWNASVLLKKELDSRGNNVGIFSIIFETYEAYKFAKKYKPDIILMPWFLTCEHEKTISSFIRLNPNVKIVNLHQEQISSKRDEIVLMPQTDYTKNGSFHFVWGNFFKEKLLSAGVEESKIFITGNVRNDEARNVTVERTFLANNYFLDVKKKWILFAENRGWLIDRYDDKTLQMYLERGYTKEQFDALYDYSKKSLENFIQQMKQLPPNFFDSIELIYRPHPGTVLKDAMPSGIHIINDRSIYDWIVNCDLYLTSESTSIFEAEICGKPCATIKDSVQKDQNDKMAGVDRYPVIDNIRMVTPDLINEMAKNSEKQNYHIYEDYLGTVNGKNYIRVANACDALENIVPENCKYDFWKKKNSFIYYKYIWEMATKVMVKMNFFEVLKFPHSAFAEKKDIPYSKENTWIHDNKKYF